MNERLSPQTLAQYRRAFADECEITAEATASCPRAESIWEAVHGKLSAAETRAIAVHLAECSCCTAAWRLAWDLGQPKYVDTRVPAGGERHPWRRWWVLAATAAGLVLVALAFRVPGRRNVAHDEIVRGRRSVDAVRSLLAPGSSLAREDAVLKWSGPAGAHFDVTVATLDLRVLTTANDLDQGVFRVPESVLTGLAPHTRLVWHVRTRTAAGSKMPDRTFITPLE